MAKSKLTAASATQHPEHGEDVLFCPVKIAIYRLGGPRAAAKALAVPLARVQRWIDPGVRERPSEAELQQLSELSDVPLKSMLRYFERLQAYRQRERQRALQAVWGDAVRLYVDTWPPQRSTVDPRVRDLFAATPKAQAVAAVMGEVLVEGLSRIAEAVDGGAVEFAA
jgi:hypothetical protein